MTAAEQQAFIAVQDELNEIKTDITAVATTAVQAFNLLGLDIDQFKDGFKMDMIPTLITEVTMKYQMGMIDIKSLQLERLLPLLDKYKHLVK